MVFNRIAFSDGGKERDFFLVGIVKQIPILRKYLDLQEICPQILTK